MKVAYGLKAHSGWAALVVLGERDGEFVHSLLRDLVEQALAFC